MELEFIRLENFLKLNVKLQKGDYLYQHDKEAFPLNKEYDISQLYFVTEVFKDELEIHSMSEKKIKVVNLKELEGFWLIMKIPNFIREKLGL